MKFGAAAALLLALAGSATATPRHIAEDVPGAQVLGSGEFRYFGMHIYDARLWTSPGRFDMAMPFALELCYARALGGRRIASASVSEMEKVAQGSAAQRSAWMGEMARLFPDVRKDDCISGHARPGAATRFYLNGKLLGEVADPAFGPAFFAIWLSPATSAPQLRERLLGMAR